MKRVGEIYIRINSWKLSNIIEILLLCCNLSSLHWQMNLIHILKGIVHTEQIMDNLIGAIHHERYANFPAGYMVNNIL